MTGMVLSVLRRILGKPVQTPAQLEALLQLPLTGSGSGTKRKGGSGLQMRRAATAQGRSTLAGNGMTTQAGCGWGTPPQPPPLLKPTLMPQKPQLALATELDGMMVITAVAAAARLQLAVMALRRGASSSDKARASWRKWRSRR